MSEQMTDIEWLEKKASSADYLASIRAGSAGNHIRIAAKRYRSIAAALREHAELRERLEGLRQEAEKLIDSLANLDYCGTEDYVKDVLATTLPADLLKVLDSVASGGSED